MTGLEAQVLDLRWVAYSDYHLAANKRETFSKVGTRWRAFVSARPCRLGGPGFGDLGLDVIDSLVSRRGRRGR
jgi:hypothetical protein